MKSSREVAKKPAALSTTILPQVNFHDSLQCTTKTKGSKLTTTDVHTTTITTVATTTTVAITATTVAATTATKEEVGLALLAVDPITTTTISVNANAPALVPNVNKALLQTHLHLAVAAHNHPVVNSNNNNRRVAANSPVAVTHPIAVANHPHVNYAKGASALHQLLKNLVMMKRVTNSAKIQHHNHHPFHNTTHLSTSIHHNIQEFSLKTTSNKNSTRTPSVAYEMMQVSLTMQS